MPDYDPYDVASLVLIQLASVCEPREHFIDSLTNMSLSHLQTQALLDPRVKPEDDEGEIEDDGGGIEDDDGGGKH